MKKIILILATISMLSSALSSITVNAEGGSVVNQDRSGVILLEDSTASATNFSTALDAKCYGGSLMWINDNSSNTTPTLTWDFNVTNASGKFDIWIVTYNVIGSVEWLSKYNYSLNNAAAIKCTAQTAYNRYEYSTPDAFYPGGIMAYMRMASGVTLQSGANTLTYTVDKRTAPDTRFINAIDRIVLIPANYCWTPKQEDYISASSTEYLTDDIPKAPFQPSSSKMIWMEAENAYSPDYSITADENASGGKSIRKGDRLDDNALTFSTEFVFDITENDSYDVWVLGASDPALGWYSRYKTSLDGETPKTYTGGYIYGGYDIRDFTMYTASVTGGSLPVRWTRANASVKLSAGTHIFDISINVRASGGGYYISQLDAVAVVPSGLNWAPYYVSAPADTENRYAWIECENSIQATNFTTVTYSANASSTFNELASNGQYVKIDGGSVELHDNEKLDYKFTLANSGTYDVYFLGSRVDQSYLSSLYYDFDNTSASIVDAGNTHKAIPSERSSTYMRDTANVIDQNYWQKIGSAISLTAGEHVLNTEWKERVQSGGKHYLSMDVYAIIPTTWSWSMPTEQTAPVYTALELDTIEHKEMLNENYAGGVTSDIEEINTYGSAGCHFTYDAKNPEYIASDGTVTRPAVYYGFSQSADVEVFAHKAKYDVSAGNSKTVSLTVLSDVEYTDFNAKYSDETEITADSLISGKTVSASVRVKKIDIDYKDALLVIAIYKNNRFERAVFEDITLTDSYQLLSTSIDLPTAVDMSEYEVRVFLWGSLENEIPYSDPLVY